MGKRKVHCPVCGSLHRRTPKAIYLLPAGRVRVGKRLVLGGRARDFQWRSDPLEIDQKTCKVKGHGVCYKCIDRVHPRPSHQSLDVHERDRQEAQLAAAIASPRPRAPPPPPPPPAVPSPPLAEQLAVVGVDVDDVDG